MTAATWRVPGSYLVVDPSQAGADVQIPGRYMSITDVGNPAQAKFSGGASSGCTAWDGTVLSARRNALRERLSYPPDTMAFRSTRPQTRLA